MASASPILTANDIQALLASEPSSKEVSKLWEGETAGYDFSANTSKVDNKLQPFQDLHQKLATGFSELLVKIGFTDVTSSLKGVEGMGGVQVVQSFDLEKNFLILWKNLKGDQEGLFSFSQSVFFKVYNRMLGGLRAYSKTGTLSDMEKTYLAKIVSDFFEEMKNAWKPFGNSTFQFSKLILGPEDLARIKWPFDCLKCVLELKTGEEIEEIGLVYPKEVLEQFASKNTSETSGDLAENSDKEWTHAILRAVGETPVSLDVELGVGRIPLHDFLKMEVGDEHPLIIPTDRHRVFLGDRLLFEASAGVLGEQRAIKILN